MRHSHERITAYERKIKELGAYDTGLTDWILFRMQYGMLMPIGCPVIKVLIISQFCFP
jgi:hypothetical protein